MLIAAAKAVCQEQQQQIVNNDLLDTVVTG
jgi:hypothetical protein